MGKVAAYDLISLCLFSFSYFIYRVPESSGNAVLAIISNRVNKKLLTIRKRKIPNERIAKKERGNQQ